MEKLKKLPFIIKGIIVVACAAVIVCAAAVGLRVLEEKQQKPRVIKAVAALFADASDEKYCIDTYFNMLQEGKISYSGELMMTEIDERLLGEKYHFIAPYINRTSMNYVLKKEQESRKASFYIEAALHGSRAVTVEGYLDDTECIVRIPDLHERYLSFSPDNLKRQYEESLLHTVLGDLVTLPEENLTDYLFSGAGKTSADEKEVLSMNFADSVRLAKELYDSITVVKTEEKEDILWNGRYESCTAYEMTVPSEILNNFFKNTLWEKSGHSILIEAGRLPVRVYLDNRKKLLKMEIGAALLLDGREVPASLDFYPKGVENPWDSVLFEIEITWDNIIYGISLVCSNDFTEDSRVLHTSLSMSQPYVTEIFDMDTTFGVNTGSVSFDFVCKTPVLSMDGICNLEPLTEAVQRPQEEAVSVFELNLIDMLKFTNGINWNFFKKQE